MLTWASVIGLLQLFVTAALAMTPCLAQHGFPPAQDAAIVEVPHRHAPSVCCHHQPPLVLVKADGSHAVLAGAARAAVVLWVVLECCCRDRRAGIEAALPCPILQTASAPLSAVLTGRLLLGLLALLYTV